MKNYYPKGSEWNKWDMHIHTPASILSNGYSDDWDLYVQTLFKTAIKENIVAIGITDYYFIDGYKKIRKEYLSNEFKLQEIFAEDEIEKIKNIFVFPNIEFRINKLVIGKEKDLKWNKKVNYHVLFSDEITPEDIEENFLNRLQFENEGVGEGASQKLALTKRNLQELGERLIKEQPEFNSHIPIQVGMLCASVDDTEIVNLLASQKSKFKGKYLLALPADEDLSSVSWTSQGHLSRKVLFQKSHIVFSSNPGTIEFSLGQRHESVEKFKEEFGKPKPCLWGSDAHSLDKLFKPDEDRYSWIKSNPTFEGLKQVVFEPEDRVKIQLNIPEKKTPYLVIDKIRYIDNTHNKTFQPNWIELNQNLNTIIGGKSSGKSLLLFHIAKAIDKEQVSEKTRLIQISDYDDFISKNPFDMEVIWKSGDKDLLSTEEKSDSQITFIPQLYINHLAEENGEQQLTDLIDSILKQNSNYKIFIEQKNLEIQECKTNIYNAIDERLIHYHTFNKLKADKNAIGNKEKITTEIKRLNKEIEKLKKESGFNEEQIKEFKKLTNSTNTISRYKSEFERSIESLNNYSNFVIAQLDSFKTNTERKLLDFKTNLLEEFLVIKTNAYVLSNLFENKEVFLKEINQLTVKLQLKLEKYNLRLQDLESMIKPFQQKVKNQELLVKLDKALKEQFSKLTQIEKINKEITGVIEKGKEARNDIFTNYEKLYDCYKDINSELKKTEYYQIDKEIKLESNLTFDCNRFEKFTNLFDNRARLNSYFVRIFDDENEFIYDEITHLQTINKIFNELKTGENQDIKLKSNVNIEDLFYKLLDDYFKINYKIIYKGDNILQMSPGKRGLVLLQLILHISNASHPILIDQPEDNLDNRTIYDELKQFVKNKKCERQIIIVTHNANLVVSADAENIIVANQSGQQVGKDKKEYVFEYISGALENTFIDEQKKGILFKYGIKEHVCDILEGGKEAFQKREMKYGFI
jgi:ABC-type dipeptide/oligopeptide/nickel transport system ATPase component